MSDIPLRNRSLRQLALFATVISAVVGAILVVVGIVMLLADTPDTDGVVVLAAGFILGLLAVILQVGISVLLKTEANVNRLHHVALDVYDVVHRLDPLVKMMAENSQISDAVRSITHRESEREALRQAIREEMYGGDWEAANYLINEMERRFGYKQEADTLRQELASVREMTIEEKITEAAGHIENLLTEHRWERARMEIERMIRLFPRHERVLALPAELTRRREVQKQELLVNWKQAVERNEIEEGIAILTQIDQYLTREEAQNLQESARGVFKARLLNLGVQFSLAVSEHRWRDALEVGLQIRAEFPNSRMAQEVTARLETLRLRAGFKTDAEITQRRPAATG